MNARPDRAYAGIAAIAWVGLVALIVLGLQTTRQLREDVADLDRSRDAQLQIQRVATTLLELESARRDDLPTRDAANLEPYRAGLARLDEALADLTALADRPDLAPDLQRLRELSDAQRAERARAEAMAEARGAGAGAALPEPREHQGPGLMDEARQVLSRLEASERATLSQRRAERTASIERNQGLVMLLAAAVGLLALALPGLLRRDRALRRRIEQGEIAAREMMERRVVERTHELQATAQSLALSEGRLRGIFDAAIDAIVTANADQVIVAANPAAARMFRGSVADLIGMPLDRLVPLRYRDAHRRELQDFAARHEAARTMGAGRQEVLGLRLDGEEFPLDAGIAQFEHHGERLYTALLRDLTDLRHAQAALRESERLMAATFNSSSVAMVQIDPATHRFVAVNESMCRLSGFAAPELLRMGPQDLDHPDDRLDPARLAEPVHREERRLVRQDGSLVWTDLSSSVLRDAEGRPLRIVAFLQDITARRQAEQDARTREARLTFFMHLNDRIRDLLDPRAIACEGCRLVGEFTKAGRVGYAEDDGSGERLSVTHNHTHGLASLEGRARYADDGPQLRAALRAGHTVVWPDIARDPSLCDEEKAVQAALGIGAAVHVPLLRDSQLSAVLFVHAAGPRQWTIDEVTLLQDIAQRLRADVERARAEAEVRQAKTQLETALESMNDAVLISDAGGRVVNLNRAFVTLHGFRSRQECLRALSIDSRILEVCAPDGTPASHDQWPVPRALRGEVASGQEYLVRRKDTGGSWMGSFSFAPIRGESGAIVGSVVSGRNVTLLKQVQADLSAAHTTLQRLMADQQRVQEDERKRIARELHDELQQQLAAIRMDAIAIGERLASGRHDVAALLNRIDRLSESAIASTRRIVSDLRPEMLEELGLVAALEALCARHAQRTGSECRLEVSSTVGAQLDGPLLSIGLYRIAQEALNNVYKHAQARTVRVGLDCTPSGLLRLRIADDGLGIQPRDARHPESFGLLGMAERVRALGGHMRVEARAERGTIVEALVPILVHAVPGDEATVDPPPPTPTEPPGSLPGAARLDAAGQPLQSVIDALDGNVAVLDPLGLIQLVNRSWRALAARHGDPKLVGCGPGISYLAVCRRSAENDRSAGMVLHGLGAVLEGREAAFVAEYPCDLGDGVQWFRMHAASITGGRVIVTHAEIHPPVTPGPSAERAPDPAGP